MRLWGRTLSKKELLAKAGSLAQLGGITRYEYCDGKAKGVTALRVRTAAGLDFTVLPDRGMDIVEASYLGRSLCWRSPAGIAHPSYYDRRDIQWLRTFAGGLLTTCGLSAVGVPSEDAGETTGLHGPVSNLPAEHYLWREQWEGDELLLTVEGSVRESSVFGPNLLLNRTIRTRLDSRAIEWNDVVRNEGPETAPLMLIYHMNFGFPLLDERSRLYATSAKVEGRTELAASHLDTWNVFDAPTGDARERVYYHTMQPDNHGRPAVVLVSNDTARDFGVELTYSAATLPHFIEWKLTQSTHYVLGLEPCNARADGRRAEREAGRLQFLSPGEEKNFNVQLRVLDGVEEVAAAIERTRQ
ncbi:MAG: aldose 1-epimerase family protein [Terracidiphilus sp.]